MQAGEKDWIAPGESHSATPSFNFTGGINIAMVDQLFTSVLPKVDHFFPGVSGSIFSWRVDHIFIDIRTFTSHPSCIT
jgi:hypothetical protein